MTFMSIRISRTHVLLATDRGGVLAAMTAGMTVPAVERRIFVAADTWPLRRISAIRRQLYVGVVNDKESGGVFVSHTAA